MNALNIRFYKLSKIPKFMKFVMKLCQSIGIPLNGMGALLLEFEFFSDQKCSNVYSFRVAIVGRGGFLVYDPEKRKEKFTMHTHKHKYYMNEECTTKQRHITYIKHNKKFGTKLYTN